MWTIAAFLVTAVIAFGVGHILGQRYANQVTVRLLTPINERLSQVLAESRRREMAKTGGGESVVANLNKAGK